MGNKFVIKKMAFNSFYFNSLEIIKEIDEVNYNNRITSGIIVDKYELLIIFSVQYKSSYINYYLYYYNYDLNSKGQKELDTIDYYAPGHGLYFRSYYLNDDYIAFIGFIDYHDGKYIFRIFKINKVNENNFDFEYILYFRDNKYSLYYDIKLNEFVKFDNERLALISTQSQTKLYIILFDLYKTYT